MCGLFGVLKVDVSLVEYSLFAKPVSSGVTTNASCNMHLLQTLLRPYTAVYSWGYNAVQMKKRWRLREPELRLT